MSSEFRRFWPNSGQIWLSLLPETKFPIVVLPLHWEITAACTYLHARTDPDEDADTATETDRRTQATRHTVPCDSLPKLSKRVAPGSRAPGHKHYPSSGARRRRGAVTPRGHARRAPARPHTVGGGRRMRAPPPTCVRGVPSPRMPRQAPRNGKGPRPPPSATAPPPLPRLRFCVAAIGSASGPNIGPASAIGP